MEKYKKVASPKSGDATTILHLLSLTIPLKGLFEQLNFADHAVAVRVEAVVGFYWLDLYILCSYRSVELCNNWRSRTCQLLQRSTLL